MTLSTCSLFNSYCCTWCIDTTILCYELIQWFYSKVTLPFYLVESCEKISHISMQTRGLDKWCISCGVVEQNELNVHLFCNCLDFGAISLLKDFLLYLWCMMHDAYCISVFISETKNRKIRLMKVLCYLSNLSFCDCLLTICYRMEWSSSSKSTCLT